MLSVFIFTFSLYFSPALWYDTKDGDVTEDPNQEDDGLDNDNTDSAADNDNTEANDDVTQTGVPAATMIMILFAVSFTAILIFKKKRAA